MQQDAEEFFNELVTFVSAGVQVSGHRMSDFLEMQLENQLSCLESTDVRID